MDLLEVQGKELYRQYQLPIAPAELVRTPQEAARAAARFGVAMLKAQIPLGHRKKLGAIVKVTPKSAERAAAKLLAKTFKGHAVHELLVEQFSQIQEEWYLSLGIDRIQRGVRLLFSRAGGIDIEEVPHSQLFSHTLPLTAQAKQELKTVLGQKHATHWDALMRIVDKLARLMREHDALLVEVNPLAVLEPATADGSSRPGGLVLLDSKITIDDAALFRQKFPVRPSTDPLVQAAHKAGVAYVPLEGTIGIIGNGAGLVMATLDMVAQAGGKAANFLDVGGGADQVRMEAALSIVLKQPNVTALLINIFGGITRTDQIAEGLMRFKQKNPTRVPIVVRLVGTNMEEARTILKRVGIEAYSEMEPAVEAVVGAKHT
ncbi:MAG: ATP-grasp domain-containing protein [Candidatus Andersenbacteria bacterium]